MSSESNFAMGSYLCVLKICFNQGIRCDSRCRCKDCGNQPTMDDVEENANRIKIDVQSPTEFIDSSKVKKYKPMSPVSNTASSHESLFGVPPALPVGYTYAYDYELPSARTLGNIEEV